MHVYKEIRKKLEKFQISLSAYSGGCDNIRTFYNDQIRNMTN